MSIAMSFNYTVRSVGFSLASAIGGRILAEGPPLSRQQRLHHHGAGRHRRHDDHDAGKPGARPPTLDRDQPVSQMGSSPHWHPTTGGSMPKGYWVSAYRTVSDPEKLAAYSELATAAVEAGGGRVLARGGRVVAHDAGIAERTVLIEFDSFEQAVAAHESAAYQEALVALSDGVERDFRIIEGID
ncbi:hypothetical protein GCM10010372_51890 [Streptomyces tauricus]|nr:hypothetical protein GCM10010372_51890 [Streptomyces tauricus]